MTDYVVSSGVTSSGITLLNHDLMTVLNGGVADRIVVNNGGGEVVSSGGTTNFTTVSSGGYEYVSAGGIASSSFVFPHGVLNVFNGGSTVGSLVAYDGKEIVSSGGHATSTVLSNGGEEYAYSGGTTYFTVVSNGGYEAALGGTASNTTVASGGYEYVGGDGGMTVATFVRYGGYEIVSQGGVSNDTLLEPGGSELIYDAAVASGTEVSADSKEFVYSGGVAGGGTVDAGGCLVLDGGSADGTVLAAGGLIDLPKLVYSAGGTAVLDTVDDVLTVTAGANSATIQLDGTYSGDYFGVVSDGNDGTLVAVEPDNGVFWSSASSGDWNDAAEWNTGEVPTSGSDVTIGAVSGIDYGYGFYAVTADAPAAAASITILNDDLYVKSQLTVTGAFTLFTGYLDLESGGTISGGTLSSPLGDVINFAGGTLSGVTYQGTLILDDNDLTVTDGITLENAAGTGPGTVDLAFDSDLYVNGNTTLNNATINLDGYHDSDDNYIYSQEDSNSPAVLTLGSGLTINAIGYGNAYLEDFGSVGDGIVNDGTINAFVPLTVYGNSFTNSGTITDNSHIRIDTYDFSNSSTGTIAIGAGATFDLDATNLDDDGTISFNGTGDTLIDDSATLPGDVFDGFAVGDSIVLAGLTFDPTGAPVLETSNVLQFEDDGNTYDLQFDPSQDFYSSEYFQLRDILGTPTIMLDGTPCYCRGTLILTDRGEIPVEDLCIGDLLVTISGEAKEVRWIGQRSYSGRFAAGNREVLPVRFTAGALGDDVPKRDLWVSPLHAMFIDGVLIPALALVNGSSIIQAEAIDLVEYFHLELAVHDVILAEGAASETFVDDDSRGMFLNAAEYHALYPDAQREPARYCAPRVEDGEELEAVRRKIAARIGGNNRVSFGPLRGVLELVRRDLIAGWAQDEEFPDAPVVLRILDNGATIARVIADRYREDLAQAGVGDGRHSFSFVVPGGLSPDRQHLIEVVRAEDGTKLTDSPKISQAWSTPIKWAEAAVA